MSPSLHAPKPVLFLLPGLLCDASVWAPQIQAFASAYEVRVPDFSGFDDLTAMAMSVLSDAPAGFSLAGHSMGARVALEVMRLAPERVERLALLDTGVHRRQEGETKRRQVLLDLADREGMEALADRWLPPMVHTEGGHAASLMPGLRAMVGRMSAEIHTRQIQALLNRPDARAGLAAIRCPVLLGVGEKDAWSPPAQHEAMAALIPHARLVIFAGAGHMAPLEAPEAVNAALKAWLDQPTAQTGYAA